MYLFEKAPGLDAYQDIIRIAIHTGKGWPVEDAFAFFANCAMLDVNRPEGEVFAYNSHGGARRQNFLRLLWGDQLNWHKKDHLKHGHLLAEHLNADQVLRQESGEWKPNEQMKDYYFDDDLSWITPEEKLPLGMYLSKNVMNDKVLGFLFDERDLVPSWAKKFPHRVHQIFPDGKSRTAQYLGVKADYYWKTDPYYVHGVKEESITEANDEINAKPTAIVHGVKEESITEANDEENAKPTAVVTPVKKCSNRGVKVETVTEWSDEDDAKPAAVDNGKPSAVVTPGKKRSWALEERSSSDSSTSSASKEKKNSKKNDYASSKGITDVLPEGLCLDRHLDDSSVSEESKTPNRDAGNKKKKARLALLQRRQTRSNKKLLDKLEDEEET